MGFLRRACGGHPRIVSRVIIGMGSLRQTRGEGNHKISENLCFFRDQCHRLSEKRDSLFNLSFMGIWHMEWKISC